MEKKFFEFWRLIISFFLFGQAYYLMQSEETRAAGEALGFGSAALFAAVFGELNL